MLGPLPFRSGLGTLRSCGVLLFSILPLASDVVQSERVAERSIGTVEIHFLTDEAETRSSTLGDRLLAFGVMDSAGHPRIAETSWRMHWRWQKKAGAEEQIAAVEPYADVVITLPFLAPDSSASEAAEWRELFKRIVRHEVTHLVHVIEGVESLDRAVSSAAAITPLSRKEAERIARNLVARVRGSDQQYDRETAHGRTEGIP